MVRKGCTGDALKTVITKYRLPAGCVRQSGRGSQHVLLLLGKTVRHDDARDRRRAAAGLARHDARPLDVSVIAGRYCPAKGYGKVGSYASGFSTGRTSTAVQPQLTCFLFQLRRARTSTMRPSRSAALALLSWQIFAGMKQSSTNPPSPRLMARYSPLNVRSISAGSGASMVSKDCTSKRQVPASVSLLLRLNTATARPVTMERFSMGCCSRSFGET